VPPAQRSLGVFLVNVGVKDHGLALPAALLYMLGLSLVVLSLARVGVLEQRLARADLDRLQARERSMALQAAMMRVLLSRAPFFVEGERLCGPGPSAKGCHVFLFPALAAGETGDNYYSETGPSLRPPVHSPDSADSLSRYRYQLVDLHSRSRWGAGEAQVRMAQRWVYRASDDR
ncbi:MAG: hypothetical protein AAGI11_19935, partial [Pseudomonadota bacterium]